MQFAEIDREQIDILISTCAHLFEREKVSGSYQLRNINVGFRSALWKDKIGIMCFNVSDK